MAVLILLFSLLITESKAFVLPGKITPSNNQCNTPRRNLQNNNEIHRRISLNSLTREDRTRQYLFMGDEQGAGTISRERSIRSKSQGWTIPTDVLEKLERNELVLPLELPLQKKDAAPSDENKNEEGEGEEKIISVRKLEEDDVSEVARMCVREYGSYPSSDVNQTTKNDISKLAEAQMVKIENFIFSFVVLSGMTQRMKRGMEENGQSDHNVLCISEVFFDIDSNTGKKIKKENMVGMAEISLQPPDPLRTSPPFVLPTFVKTLISSVTGAGPLLPYISNVLITNEYRGKGYSKVLMSACEGLAKSWGFKEAYLHCDADTRSGITPQALYRSLGYKPVVNEDRNAKFDWMGPEMMLRGLYVVDGLPLLFLRKELS